MFAFKRLKEADLEMVMRWRLQPEVAEYMFTTIDNDLQKQRQWFHKVSQDDSCRYWIIEYQNIPIGVVNLMAIDVVNQRCGAGYYIGDLKYKNVGALVPPFLYNHVFKTMGLHKIYGEVIAHNKGILQIHAMHGYHQVGVSKDHVYKDGRFHDVVMVELLAGAWGQQKRYQKDIAHFE